MEGEARYQGELRTRAKTKSSRIGKWPVWRIQSADPKSLVQLNAIVIPVRRGVIPVGITGPRGFADTGGDSSFVASGQCFSRQNAARKHPPEGWGKGRPSHAVMNLSSK